MTNIQYLSGGGANSVDPNIPPQYLQQPQRMAHLPLPQSVTGNQPLTTPTVQFQYVGQPQSLVQPHSSVQPLNSTQQVSVIPPSSVQPLNSTQQVSVIPSSSVQPLINSTQQAMRIPGPQTQGLPQTIMGPPHQVSSSGGPSSTPYRSRSPDPP
ncbi:uncharacterized protein LOC144625146 isoform X1 [Crassostrea virginica]